MDQKLSREKIIYPTENPSLLLWQLNLLWQNTKKEAITHIANLSSLQYMVMVNIKWLVCKNKHVTQVQLAEHLGMEAMNISQVLKILTNKGYVMRKEHSLDTRAKSIFLTEEGARITDAASAKINEAEKAFFKILGDDSKRFMEDMSTLIKQMKIERYTINNVEIAEIISDIVVISNSQDAMDIIASCAYDGAENIIINKSNLADDFFNLASGIAGGILQKFSTYNLRLAIVGDFREYTNKNLNAFILESNKTGRIHFVNSKDEAQKVLAGKYVRK